MQGNTLRACSVVKNAGRMIIMNKDDETKRNELKMRSYELHKDMLKIHHEINAVKGHDIIKLILKHKLRKEIKKIGKKRDKGDFSDKQFEELMEIIKDDID